jgi:hypothetical protein
VDWGQEKPDPLGLSACALLNHFKSHLRVCISDRRRRAYEIPGVKMYVTRLVDGDDEAPLLRFRVYEFDPSFHSGLLLPDNAGE